MTGDINIKRKGDYEFACWYWETSRAWGHEVRLCKNGVEVGRSRVRYYNRTWECYTYQSTMYGAVEDYERRERARYLERYKYNHELAGYDMEKHELFNKPFKRGQKAQALAEFAESDIAKDIKELNEFVKEGK